MSRRKSARIAKKNATRKSSRIAHRVHFGDDVIAPPSNTNASGSNPSNSNNNQSQPITSITSGTTALNPAAPSLTASDPTDHASSGAISTVPVNSTVPITTAPVNSTVPTSNLSSTNNIPAVNTTNQTRLSPPRNPNSNNDLQAALPALFPQVPPPNNPTTSFSLKSIPSDSINIIINGKSEGNSTPVILLMDYVAPFSVGGTCGTISDNKHYIRFAFFGKKRSNIPTTNNVVCFPSGSIKIRIVAGYFIAVIYAFGDYVDNTSARSTSIVDATVLLATKNPTHATNVFPNLATESVIDDPSYCRAYDLSFAELMSAVKNHIPIYEGTFIIEIFARLEFGKVAPHISYSNLLSKYVTSVINKQQLANLVIPGNSNKDNDEDDQKTEELNNSDDDFIMQNPPITPKHPIDMHSNVNVLSQKHDMSTQNNGNSSQNLQQNNSQLSQHSHHRLFCANSGVCFMSFCHYFVSTNWFICILVAQKYFYYNLSYTVPCHT